MRVRRSAWLLLIGFLAATGAGYWISSVIGTEILRREVEVQLTSLLAGPTQIDQVGLALNNGLFLQGESVSVYPDPDSVMGARLFSKRVVAEVDLLALMTGRFRLSGLILEDPVFDIRRDSSGGWHPYPVEALAGIEANNRSQSAEAYLDFFAAFEGVTRTLLSAPIAADRIELRRARILFRDETKSLDPANPQPVTLAFENVYGLLVHHWLSGEAQLIIEGALRQDSQRQTPIEIIGANDGAGEQRLRISANALDLGILDPYLASKPSSPWPNGSLSGWLDYTTSHQKSGRLILDWTVDEFESRVSLDHGQRAIKRKKVSFAATGSIDPDSVHATGTLADATGMRLLLDAETRRPLAEDSVINVSAGVYGLSLKRLRQLTREFSDDGEGSLNPLVAGRADPLGMEGAISLQRWGALLSGEPKRLPEELKVFAELEGLAFSSEAGDQFRELGARVEFRGDTFHLRGGRGRRNNEALPTLNLRINGFSNLLGAQVRQGAEPSELPELAGLNPLFEIFGDRDEGSTSLPDGENPEQAAPGGIDRGINYKVWLDRLDHPAIPWTIRDAEFNIVQDEANTIMHGESLVVGDVPVTGDLTWTDSAGGRLLLVLKALPPLEPREEAPKADTLPTEALEEIDSFGALPPASPWVSGRIELQRVETPLLPLNEVRTQFSISGTTLRLFGFRAALDPTGMVSAEAELQLDQPTHVPLALDFSIKNGDMETTATIFGLKTGDISGIFELSGNLAGDLRPEVVLLDELEGSLDLLARRGELRRRELPLLLALAQASEGYNDYAARDSIAYDSITATMYLEEDRIVTQNFELEGPLRIIASGSLDAVHPPYDIVGVAGLFLFRGAGQILEALPLVKIILPGSEKGLVGTYYQISGNLDEPKVRALAGRSVAESLPDALEAPYQILRAILSGGQIDEGRTSHEVPPDTSPAAPSAEQQAPAAEPPN
ncbi:MAG: hypothetical protein OSB70_10400 [Myxococcota bacterium]|nr:hypothetical protein [Myxococcota bacterium]